MSCLLLSDRNRLTDLENKLMVARVEGWREGIVREFEMNVYTMYLKWLTHKDRLYRTGNTAQCPGSLDGRGVWGRMDACTCRAESLHCSSETITTILIGYLAHLVKNLSAMQETRV